MSAAGTRGGNVRDLDTARDLQAQVKDKRDWSGAIDEQIRLTLVGTGAVHANDLDGLEVPAQHRNLIGTRMARYCNKGWMKSTTERRKVTHPAANGRKNPVYRITSKGWRELTGGVDVSHGAASPLAADSTTVADIHPGEQSAPTGAPSPQGTDRPNPPVPSASVQSGEGSGVASQAPEPDARLYEPLSLLPEPDPEAWAA